MAKTNLKAVEKKNDSLAEARKIAKDLRERGDNFIYEFLEREDEPVDEKIHALVREALIKLTPIKAMLVDENLNNLEDYYKFTTTVNTVKEVHNLLTAADAMYFTVH